MVQSQLLIRGAAFAVLFVLSGCDSKTTPPPTAVPQPPPISAEQVRDAIAQRNFGTAADLAQKLVSEQPKDAGAWLLDAQAQAQLGNSGSAAQAFRKAVDLGLADPASAASNTLFDPVRDDQAFRAILVRAASPAVHDRPATAAGDVEIRNDGSVRAGDVSIGADR